jgi:ELWxxDGT repeat protein
MFRGRSLGILLCSVFGIFLPALTAGQPASLVVDLNSSRYDFDPPQGSFQEMKAAGDRLYMVSAGGNAGSELWVSDGTSSGTEVVRDLCPGSCGVDPSLIGALGKLMFWTADSQLWRSDGTRPGTFALSGPDLEVGPLFSYAFFGRALYFVACAGQGQERSCDLWRSDGSAAGTRLFHAASRWVTRMAAGDGKLYFQTVEELNEPGSDLWVTDGTAAGTVKLRHFDDYVGPSELTTVGDRLFFVAWDDGQEVWTSDGTVAGTRPLTKLTPPRALDDARFRVDGGRVYFEADDGTHGHELWRTDGTAAGTVRVTELEDDDPIRTSVVDLNGVLVFGANDGRSPEGLWTSRGTPASTAPLPITCGDCEVFLSDLVESGGKAFFAMANGVWVTDGTAAGTRHVETLCAPCTPRVLLPWHDGVIFEKEDEIRFTDGTVTRTLGRAEAASLITPLQIAEVGGQTYFLAERDRDRTGGLWIAGGSRNSRPVFTHSLTGPASSPWSLAAIGDRLVFKAWDGQERYGLWSSAGTAETTNFLVPNLPELYWGEASDFVPAAGHLFFQVGQARQENDLWTTDGTAQGTIHLAHLPDRAVLVPFQNVLYLFSGQEIWRSDGTVAGTVRVGSFPENLVLVEAAAAGANGMVLKAQTAPGYGDEFWFSDGSTAGTRQLTSFNSSGTSGFDPEMTAVGAAVYFSWDQRLWRTDGTPAGTVAVDWLPVPAGEYPVRLFSYQGALYLFTTGYTSLYNLHFWRTDGTATGTVQLAVFPWQSIPDDALRLTPFAGKLFFNVGDGVHGVELWSTDGTSSGTGLVRDLFPGPRSSKPTQLTVAGGRLFFTAGDDLHGIELWQSDGTAAGTRLVQDIAPQAGSSAPDQLTVVGDKLLFTADDGITGRELWVLPLSGPSSCKPSPTRLCLGGGRYAVEAAWRDFQNHKGVGHAAPLTADTGTFWFFDSSNVEVVLKVLDGRGVNGHEWVFYGALSNVEYTLTITDTQTGLSHRYINPSGQLASVADTKAFGPLGATTEASVSSPSPSVQVDRRAAKATAVCAPSSTRLCLNGDRFAVEISWKDFEGKTGVGKAVGMTGDTGYFWFFNESNVEVVLKVLDGRPVNGHHWVFYGALSSVEYTVTVTDTQTGKVNTYRNPSGRLASVADTGAF